MLPGAHTEEINMEITVNLTFSDAAEAARVLASIAGTRAETPEPKTKQAETPPACCRGHTLRKLTWKSLST